MATFGIETICLDERQPRTGEILVECSPATVTSLVEHCDTADRLIAVIPERAAEPLTGMLEEIATGLRKLIDLEPGSEFEDRSRRLESAIAARCLKLWAERERHLLLGSYSEGKSTTLVLAFAKVSVDRCIVTIPIS